MQGKPSKTIAVVICTRHDYININSATKHWLYLRDCVKNKPK